MAFVQVYDCPKCGEVDPQSHTFIDCERDDVETFLVCPRCMRDVIPRVVDGKHIWRPLTEEELEFERIEELLDED